LYRLRPVCYQRRKINVSQVFAGQTVGVKQVDDHLWLVTFMDVSGIDPDSIGAPGTLHLFPRPRRWACAAPAGCTQRRHRARARWKGPGFGRGRLPGTPPAIDA
jgi:hypothetical protein